MPTLRIRLRWRNSSPKIRRHRIKLQIDIKFTNKYKSSAQKLPATALEYRKLE